MTIAKWGFICFPFQRSHLLLGWFSDSSGLVYHTLPTTVALNET